MNKLFITHTKRYQPTWKKERYAVTDSLVFDLAEGIVANLANKGLARNITKDTNGHLKTIDFERKSFAKIKIKR